MKKNLQHIPKLWLCNGFTLFIMFSNPRYQNQIAPMARFLERLLEKKKYRYMSYRRGGYIIMNQYHTTGIETWILALNLFLTSTYL